MDQSKGESLVKRIFEGVQIPYLWFLNTAQKLVCNIPQRVRNGMLSVFMIVLSVY